MTFYNDVIESMPLRVQMTTHEVTVAVAEHRKKKVESWEEKSWSSQVYEALKKGCKREEIRKLPNVRIDNKEVAVWMRI